MVCPPVVTVSSYRVRPTVRIKEQVMSRHTILRSSAVAVLALLTTAAAASAEDLLVTGTGKVNQDFTEVGPNTQAFTITLKGTRTVGDEDFHFNNATANVVQIFPPGPTSSFWNEVTLDLKHGNTLNASIVAHYSAETNCYEGTYQLDGGTGIFAGAQGSGMTLTCPVEGVFMWEGTIR
jgi:hypothetical protein